MAADLLELLVRSAEGAFLQVTVFVGAVLILFGYINYKKQGRLVQSIVEHKKWQPVMGAILGLTPGCGGAILVMPLFLKGSVSFGTVVAALIATAGDSAFVMISTLPFHYLLVSALSFLVAIVTGYAVDHFGKKRNVPVKADTPARASFDEHRDHVDHRIQDRALQDATESRAARLIHIGHEEGDEIDRVLHHEIKGHQDPDTLGHKITHKGYWIYWLIILAGLVLGVLLLCQIDFEALGVSTHVTVIGAAGTFLSIILMIMGKKFLSDDTHEESELKLMSLKETFVHNAQETAFVGTWVFVAYLLYEILIFSIGGGDFAQGEELAMEIMTAAGLLAVIVGALVGIIPGCGPQIIFVALFIKGWLPFAALLSNAISQDGDALFPLLAMDKKSAFKATLITTVPALVVGVVVYYFEVKFLSGILMP